MSDGMSLGETTFSKILLKPEYPPFPGEGLDSSGTDASLFYSILQ